MQKSPVAAVPAAAPADALSHFEGSLRFETDCWDVNHGLATGQRDFVLLDVRSAESFARGHVPGAIRLARLGRPAKIMVGGVTGWLDEGFALEARQEAAA